jgi:hypothetical protein
MRHLDVMDLDPRRLLDNLLTLNRLLSPTWLVVAAKQQLEPEMYLGYNASTEPALNATNWTIEGGN